MIIRALKATDEAEWRRLWTGYLDFYGCTVGEDVYQTTFARLLDPHRAQYALIADVEGGPCGLVHFLPHAHNWKFNDVIYLQDLYVDPAARGTGIGRALIEAVYAEADRIGAADVYWMTQEFNAAARTLYDQVGRLTPFIKYTR